MKITGLRTYELTLNYLRVTVNYSELPSLVDLLNF